MTGIISTGNSKVTASNIRTFKPVGYTDFPPLPIGQVIYHGQSWEECRQVWVKEADVLFVVGGGTGTKYEIECALTQRIPVVILRGTGGAADEIASSLNERNMAERSIVTLIDCQPDTLSNVTTLKQIAETIVNQLQKVIVSSQVQK